MARFRFETKKAGEKPLEYKSFIARGWKADPQDENILEGYAAVFTNIDDGGDRILPGAFTKTIAERVPTGNVKLVDSHDWSCRGVIGTIIEAREDERGLFIRAKFSSDPTAQSIRLKILEGHLGKFSIGYETVNAKDEIVDGVRVRDLVELKLREVSVVPFPMNELAVITGVKTEDLEAALSRKEGRVLSTQNVTQIREALKTIGAVRASLQGLLDAAEPPEKGLSDTHRDPPDAAPTAAADGDAEPPDEITALHIKAARNRLKLLTLKGD